MAKADFKVIIAGTRDFSDYAFLREKCDAILSNRKHDSNIVIVSGTARGADRLGEQYARERGYRIERYPADWDRDGNSAGPIRNAKMADNAHALIAFWDGQSRGTMNMIETAKSKGLMVRTVITNTIIQQNLQETKRLHLTALSEELNLFADDNGRQPENNSNIIYSNKVEDMETKNEQNSVKLVETGYDSELQAYTGYVEGTRTDFTDERDEAINQKLGQLRQMLGNDDFTLTDVDNSTEVVMDFEVGHFFGGTYGLSPVLAKSGRQAPKEYDYDGLLRELNNKLNAVRPKKYTADFLVKHPVKAIEVDVERRGPDPDQNKVTGVTVKGLVTSNDHILHLVGAKIIDANIDWGDHILETGKKNPADYMIGSSLHQHLGKDLADKILSMKESGSIPYPEVSDDAGLLNEFYTEQAGLYVDQAKEAIISRTTSPSSRQFEPEQEKSILPSGMRLSAEERTALFEDLWKGTEGILAEARTPDAWKQSAHDELTDLAKNGTEQHHSHGLHR